MAFFRKFFGKFIGTSFLVLGLLWLAGCSSASKTSAESSSAIMLEKAQNLFDKKLYTDAIRVAGELEEKYPTAPEVLPGKTLQANAYFEKKSYEAAALHYKVLLNLRSHKNPDFLLFRIASSYYKDTPKLIERDLKSSEQALEYIDKLLLKYPKSSYALEAKAMKKDILTKQVDKNISIAEFYLKQKKYKSANQRFVKVYNYSRDLLDAKREQKVLYGAAFSYYLLQNLEAGQKLYFKLLKKYPQSKELAKLKLFLDRKL